MKIIVPTYRRANNCQTAKYLSSAILLVNESEVEEYRKNYPNEILPMPDRYGGNMARVRNYILNNVNDDLVMMDDDIKYIGYFENSCVYKMKEAEVLERFKNFFEMANDARTPLWGINVVNSRKAYREYSPLSLSSVVLGPCMGITKGCLVRFDEDLGLKEDYDFSLQILNKYRKILRFNKYHYLCGHIKVKGGCASYRTRDIEAEQMKRFVRKWGNSIVRFEKGDINPVVSVPIRGI
jgi:hypothetical protein